VALHAAEEESIEALKKWWDENGKRLLLIVITAFGAYGGWLFWQNTQAANAEAASELYEQILDLNVTEPGVAITEADRARILMVSEELRAEYAGSVYALFGALFAAQQQVAADDLDGAEDSLQWVLDNQRQGWFSQTDEGLILVTNLRLGRVILAKGEPERALNLVNSVAPKSFEAGFSELRGDIYAAMGRMINARDAYIAAQEAGSNSDALRMKLGNLPDES
jgi:predicted negative regulator of RcsB-dependent stress response